MSGAVSSNRFAADTLVIDVQRNKALSRRRMGPLEKICWDGVRIYWSKRNVPDFSVGDCVRQVNA
jgi:hypothetical protein